MLRGSSWTLPHACREMMIPTAYPFLLLLHFGEPTVMGKKLMNLRFWSFVSLFLFGICLAAGCAEKPKPEPTETKEERRLKEKEMMHREMQNK